MTKPWTLDSNAKRRLMDWYEVSRRPLPWRDTRDPYRVLVSEVMLQQTQAERVVPKYHEFLAKFPTFEALAAAPAGDVIRAWSGLGYNRRALNLQRACREVVERHGGELSSDPAELATLPGIGPYTAGAVACFAREADVGFVDTNIRRVLLRVLSGPELPKPAMTARDVDQAARDLVPAGKGYVWNQALMELGATICRARRTECERCPLRDDCLARPTIQILLASPRQTRDKAEQKFEKSSRYYRGRIVAALRAAPPEGLSLRRLGRLLRPDFRDDDASWIAAHIAGLERDGLIARAQDQTSRALQEDTAIYAAAPPDLRQRYRLPD